MTTQALGLRERKRLATKRSIQVAVLTLIEEKGLDSVTVEDISGRAHVSARTFFNYFPSKEGAAIGEPLQLHDRGLEERFVTAGPSADLLDGIADLLVSAVDQLIDDVDLLHLRRAVLRANPSLFAMRMASLRSFEEELAAVVERRLEADAASDDSVGMRAAERARLITFVAIAALRHGWLAWAESDGHGTPSDRIRSSFAELNRLMTGERV